MSLQNPAALWLALPLMGFIVALYFLRMRRREFRVPATFLWPERTDEIRANALFQKLRPSWLLFLQLLAVALAVVCLAKPQLKQRGLTGEVTVFVLDRSASMSATDVKPSRFEEAKRIAQEAIRSSKPGDRVALIEAGPTPRVVFPLGSDPVRQVAALNGLEGSDAESEIGEAMRLATALVNDLEGARIVLLSDGVFPEVRNFTAGKASVVFQPIGSSAENLAVEALGTSDAPSGRLLYAGVRNYGLAARTATLSLFADGKAIDSVRLTVSAGGSQGRTIAAPTGVQLFEAKLDAKDALAADDYAATAADPTATLRVLKVGGEDPFVDRALALDPRVTLDRAEALPADGGEGYDIVVFDGVTSEPTQSRGTLILGRAGKGAPVSVQGNAKGPEIKEAEKVALLKGVDFDNVYIDSAERTTANGSAKVLVSSSAGPLVVTQEAKARRTVYLAFAPLQSDFPLQVSFPIFIANVLDYLGGQAGSGPLIVSAGRPFTLAANGDTAQITSPDGESTKLRPVGGTSTVREADRVGKYTYQSGAAKRTILATLRSPGESKVDPVQNIRLATQLVKAQTAPLRFYDFWRPLALLGLCVLGVEWWLFARRS